jgi:hypothetical protein
LAEEHDPDDEFDVKIFKGDNHPLDLAQIIREMKARKRRPIPEAAQSLKKRAKNLEENNK